MILRTLSMVSGPQFPYLRNGDSNKDLLPRFPVGAERKGTVRGSLKLTIGLIAVRITMMLSSYLNVEFERLWRALFSRGI